MQMCLLGCVVCSQVSPCSVVVYHEDCKNAATVSNSAAGDCNSAQMEFQRWLLTQMQTGLISTTGSGCRFVILFSVTLSQLTVLGARQQSQTELCRERPVRSSSLIPNEGDNLWTHHLFQELIIIIIIIIHL